jgi:hypothetical protein
VPTPRSRAQRRRDTEHRLTQAVDVWAASASADGAPYLVPLSFDWDGEAPPKPSKSARGAAWASPATSRGTTGPPPGGNASGDREAPARDRDGPYSPECVEEEFCEVRGSDLQRQGPGSLRGIPASFAPSKR